MVFDVKSYKLLGVASMTCSFADHDDLVKYQDSLNIPYITRKIFEILTGNSMLLAMTYSNILISHVVFGCPSRTNPWDILRQIDYNVCNFYVNMFFCRQVPYQKCHISGYHRRDG